MPIGVREGPGSSSERLELAADLEASPADVWRAFTEPEVLTAWWSEEAATDPTIGGTIEARWPSMGWVMRGRYTELDPGRVVAFTWSWDHEPEVPDREVRVSLESCDGGSRLTLTHGTYGPGDADERQGHLDGWLNFLPRIDQVLDT